MSFVRHGSYTAYTHHGCRCDVCRAANAANQRRYLAAHPEQRARNRARDRRRRERAKQRETGSGSVKLPESG